MVTLLRYQRADGREPFTEWLVSMRDKVAQARIRMRLRQIEAGNFGDVEPVGEGVSELRIHVGAGYRVYFGQHGRTIVILLSGGDKGRQVADVQQAKAYWQDWKTRQT
jgi:putative addiction module killer protein